MLDPEHYENVFAFLRSNLICAGTAFHVLEKRRLVSERESPYLLFLWSSAFSGHLLMASPTLHSPSTRYFQTPLFWPLATALGRGLSILFSGPYRTLSG